MEAIYPITALQKNSAQVKDEARRKLVHVTENGHAAFVFMSEEVLDELISREREKAVWEAQMLLSIDRGLAGMAQGRFCETQTADELMDAVFGDDEGHGPGETPAA